MRWRLPRVFITYRRDDSVLQARNLHGDLVKSFGEARVFLDLDRIEYGDEFRGVIDRHLADADVVVAVIGPKWLTIAGDDGRPRLWSDDDIVRHEVASALRSGKQLIPVLVGGADVPAAAAMPPDLAALARLNALALSDRDVGKGADELVGAIWKERPGHWIYRSMQRRVTRAVGLGLALAMLFAAWISLFDFFSLDTKSASLTLWLADVVSPEPVSADLQLIVIGAATEAALGKSFQANPAVRRDHARLIDRLAQAGARTIAFDFFFTRPSDADDAVLAQSVTQARRQGTAIVFGARDIGRDGLPAMVPALRSAVTTWAMLCIGQKLGYASAVPLLSQRTLAGAGASAGAGAGAGAGVGEPGAGAGEPGARPQTQTQTLAVGLALAAASPGANRTATIMADVRKVLVWGEPEGATREYRYSEVERVTVPQPSCPVVLPGDMVTTALYRMSPLEVLQGDAHRVAYEQVLAQDADTLRQRFQGKTVLVGMQLPDVDAFPVFRGWTGELRHGLELHGDATSALLRNAVVQPLGWVGHFVAMLAATLLGSTLRQWSPQGWSWPRRAVLTAAALACLGFAVWLCVAYGVLLNVTYVVGALLAGHWSAGWLGSRAGVRKAALA